MQRAWLDPVRRADGRAAVAMWRSAVPDRVPGHCFITYFYAELGPTDSAFALLQRGIAARDSGIPLTLEFPHYDAVRGDARWSGMYGKCAVADGDEKSVPTVLQFPPAFLPRSQPEARALTR